MIDSKTLTSSLSCGRNNLKKFEVNSSSNTKVTGHIQKTNFRHFEMNLMRDCSHDQVISDNYNDLKAHADLVKVLTCLFDFIRLAWEKIKKCIKISRVWTWYPSNWSYKGDLSDQCQDNVGMPYIKLELLKSSIIQKWWHETSRTLYAWHSLFLPLFALTKEERSLKITKIGKVKCKGRGRLSVNPGALPPCQGTKMSS